MKRYVIAIFVTATLMFSGCSLDNTGQNIEKEMVQSSIVNTENTVETKKTKIAEYQNRLDELNKKYDTDYSFPNNEEGIEWLLSLSPEQFDSYIMSYIDGSVHDIEKPRLRNEMADLGMGSINNYNNIEENKKMP